MNRLKLLTDGELLYLQKELRRDIRLVLEEYCKDRGLTFGEYAGMSDWIDKLEGYAVEVHLRELECEENGKG